MWGICICSNGPGYSNTIPRYPVPTFINPTFPPHTALGSANRGFSFFSHNTKTKLHHSQQTPSMDTDTTSVSTDTVTKAEPMAETTQQPLVKKQKRVTFYGSVLMHPYGSLVPVTGLKKHWKTTTTTMQLSITTLAASWSKAPKEVKHRHPRKAHKEPVSGIATENLGHEGGGHLFGTKEQKPKPKPKRKRKRKRDQ